MLFHVKIKTLINLFKETGIFDGILNQLNKEQVEQFLNFDRIINKGENNS